MYVFLTNSEGAQSFTGCVPKIGSLCDSSREKRTGITRYLGGDAETALVKIIVQRKFYYIISIGI